MASSISFRLCRNVFRNWRSSRFVVSASSKVSSTNAIIDFDNGRHLIQSIGVCGFHSSATNWKKKPDKRKAVQEAESASEDEESEEEKEEVDLSKDYRLVDCAVAALRVDTIAKVALGLPRVSVEQLLHEGKIRVDGKLCQKKAAIVDLGTTIDLLLDATADNPDFSLVKRVQVHKIGDKSDGQGRFVVTVKRWAQLTVDDYKIGGSGRN